MPKGRIKIEKNDEDSDDDGNMLNDLDKEDVDVDFAKNQQEENEHKLFGCGNSTLHYNRVTRNF